MSYFDKLIGSVLHRVINMCVEGVQQVDDMRVGNITIL